MEIALEEKEIHCVAYFAIYVPNWINQILVVTKILLLSDFKIIVLTFLNGCNKVVIKLRVVQFWSEMILVHVISNQTRPAHLFYFEIPRMISYQIALHSVQLPL